MHQIYLVYSKDDYSPIAFVDKATADEVCTRLNCVIEVVPLIGTCPVWFDKLPDEEVTTDGV